ncbi:MAG TPA: carboxypeptidase regulatory-like domain-containing protein [Vicinamibacterales bacterium]|nr:carboxypeptidase regulatory-like domain-containing protein [Vicinamibacterales bacterium]
MSTQFVRLPRIVSSLVLASFGLVAACGGKDAQPPASSAKPGKPVDAATAGSVSGKVVYSGTPPTVETIRMNTDPVCAQSGASVPSEAAIVGANGAVKNAFVYVKDGLDPAYSFDVPTAAVVLDQQGCKYTPHVVGVRVGQPIDIVNSDDTLHNVHAMPMTNQEFNQGQPVKGFRMTKTFTAPEVMVRFVCNVHGWMRAYVGVMAHPYFAVTDADGAFKIPNLPPGTYTIGVWHETFLTQEQKVTVAEKQDATVSLTATAK